MEKLTNESIDERMRDFTDWSLISEALQRTFRFEGFVEAMAFVGRVADLAERHEHYPDIMVRYNKVTLTLTSDEVNGLSGEDFQLAHDIDLLVAPV